MWMSKQKMVETLRLALEERSPKTYRTLSDSGALQKYLEERADVIADGASDAAANTPRPENLGWLETQGALERIRNTAWRIALEEGIMDLPSDEREEDAEEE